MDSSGSISRKQFDQSRHFVKRVSAQLPVGNGGANTHISIVQFSNASHESLEIGLMDGVSQKAVEDAVNKMREHKSKIEDPQTHTGEAVEYVLDHVFPQSKSHTETAKTLVLVTDSKSNGAISPKKATAMASSLGITVIAVGVSNYNEDELLTLTGGDKSKVFTLKEHKALHEVLGQIVKVICQNEPSAEPTPQPTLAPTPKPTPRPTPVLTPKPCTLLVGGKDCDRPEHHQWRKFGKQHYRGSNWKQYWFEKSIEVSGFCSRVLVLSANSGSIKNWKKNRRIDLHNVTTGCYNIHAPGYSRKFWWRGFWISQFDTRS